MYITINTKRLSIRPIKLTDAEFILELVNTEGWLKFIGDRNVSNAIDAEKYIRNILDSPNYHYNVFELKETHEPIGIVTFLKRDTEEFPDIGFAILPQFEKNGYTIEACKAYLDEIKKLKKIKKVIAITLPHNQTSISVLKKLGLNYDRDVEREGETISYYSINF